MLANLVKIYIQPHQKFLHDLWVWQKKNVACLAQTSIFKQQFVKQSVKKWKEL